MVVAPLAESERDELPDLADHTAHVAGPGEPPPDALRDRRGGDAVTDDPRLEEVLTDELLQAPAELVLAPRDESGVGHRQPERVLEQGGDREPVGDGTHHRSLRPRVDEPERSVSVQG